MLVEHAGRLLTKDELMRCVWPDSVVEENNLNHNISVLRRAVGEQATGQRYIETVPRVGYRFVADVKQSGLTTRAHDPAPPVAPAQTLRQVIRFCTATDGARIAYSTVGEGPPLVKAANWLNHLEHEWESPVWKHWVADLSQHHVFVRYDERGCGLSDWNIWISRSTRGCATWRPWWTRSAWNDLPCSAFRRAEPWLPPTRRDILSASVI